MSDTNNEDPDLAATHAAAAPAATYLSGETNVNKWSKNGYGAPVSKQSGKFSREESELVRKAVEEFCAARQIPTARLCSECEHKTELKGAWMEIAKRLPHRSVQSVYRHGIRQLHPFKRGAWSEQECTMLSELVQRMGKKWSAIQSKLNRSADSCRDKYREMSDDFIKGRWKEQETEMLKRVIREYLRVDPTADMRELGKMVEENNISISWTYISKRMGRRSRLSCFKKWQKMTGNGVMQVTEEDDEPPTKRPRIEDSRGHHQDHHHDEDGMKAPYADAPTAGAAAAMAVAAASSQENPGDYDVYSAKIAAETVEAVDLPDTDTLLPAQVQ